MSEENITFRADELPEGHPLRRLAALTQHHTDDEKCWCEPTIHRVPAAELVGTAIELMDGYVPGEDMVFVKHNVVADDDEAAG